MVEMTKKIFVVDDEPQIVKVLKAYLEKAGYQVVTASDGNAVLSIFRHEKPDFLILDLNLPGMDGLDICKAIRRDSSVPILMLTARGSESDKVRGLDAGAEVRLGGSGLGEISSVARGLHDGSESGGVMGLKAFVDLELPIPTCPVAAPVADDEVGPFVTV